MSWDDFKDKKPQEEKAKNPIYRSTGVGHFYAIFRIGKKYKTIGQIKGFTKHMERLQDTPNANTEVKNELIMGNKDVDNHVKEYIKDVKYIRPDTTIARELLLTASPQFFREMNKKDIDRWTECNMNWLQKEFGENFIYSTLHLDETTPHIHALIVPKIWSEKRNCYTLSNSYYFDGIQKFRDWQDKYSMTMKNSFQSLNRGIKNSKAKHIEIKHFYGILNMKLNEKDLESICAKAKNSELLELKLKALEKTLESYRKTYYSKDKQAADLEKENKELIRNIKDLNADKELFHEALETLSQRYKLPQNAIKEVLKYLEKENEFDRS